jgi:AraC-like DNA-binding protein
MTTNRFQRRVGMAPGVVASATAYTSEGMEPGWHRGLPSPWLTFIVSVDGPVRVSGTVEEAEGGFDPTRATSYDVIVAGLHPVAAVVEQPARQAGVQLALDPLAAPALLGCRAADLVTAGDHGHEVIGRAAAELHERVASVAGDQARLDVVQAWVRARIDRAPSRAPRPEVVRTWDLLARSQGRRRIADVARDVALSPRQLRVLVESEVGLSPKALARSFRFSAVVDGLTSGRPPAEVAATTGYADQAHLSREFRQMVGCSPTTWLAEERRNIQDGGHRNRPE